LGKHLATIADQWSYARRIVFDDATCIVNNFRLPSYDLHLIHQYILLKIFGGVSFSLLTCYIYCGVIAGLENSFEENLGFWLFT